MSNSLNKVQLIGNLTSDPDVRETSNGQNVAAFSVATNRKWKDSAGVIQEEVEFHNCVAWRGLADIVEQYTNKGKKVYVEGYLKTRTWDDNAGIKRYRTEIILDNVILLGGPKKNDEHNQGPVIDDVQVPPEPKKRKAPPPGEEIGIDDISF